MIRSTVISGAAALAVLTIFYLPAEYGMDVTGLRGIPGLIEMGQIKQQLYAEAASDDAAAAAKVMTLDPRCNGSVGTDGSAIADDWGNHWRTSDRSSRARRRKRA